MSAALRFGIGGFFCLSAGWYLGGVQLQQTRLTFLSVGQGDCAVIQHKGRTILVDAGPSEQAARWDVMPKLRLLGVTDVDLVLLTHPDLDHIGGIPVLARAFPRATFSMPSAFEKNVDWLDHVREFGLAPNRVKYLPRQMTGDLGDLRIDVYCPEVWPGGSDNDGSMFLRVSEGNASAVLSGDASAEAEAVVAVNGDWSSQIMKAGHHGSRSSSSWEWLSEVKPKWVVVSCGRNNSYGHPHKEVLERAASVHAQLARTDRGDVRFILKGGSFVLESPDHSTESGDAH
ncbi:MAG: ComEC/Rec2 family competence protein [Fimbriimonas sp.]